MEVFMRLRPLLDNVVIKPSKKEEVTTGGIIIPDTGTEGPVRGEVIAVGPGNYTEKGEYIPMNVSVGDEVLYGTKLYGTEVSVDDNKYLIIRQSNILAVIEK
jgi:chaperonin GroES